MPLRDSPRTFGWMSILNHWSIAVLIIVLLVSGLVLEEMAHGAAKGALIDVHKQLGVLALLLALWRIGWQRLQERTQAVPESATWTRRARAALHLLLVVASLALPVSGVLMSLYGGHAVSFLGLTMPAQGEVAAIGEPAHVVHALGGKLMIAAIAAHALAALKHHFIDHDATLVRMLGRPS